MAENNRVPGPKRMLKSLFVLSFIVVSSFSFSQTLTSSPYSRYGLGDLQSNGSAQNYALGGAGIGWRSDTLTPSYINYLNPASYSAMRITVIELGVLSNSTQFITSDQKFSLNNTSFSYIAVGLPIKKWWGLAFGVMPYSNVGYKIHDTQTKDTIGTINYNYEGSGGINKVFLGNGFKLLSNKYSQRTGTDLSIGFNASYVFGSINNIRHVSFDDPNYYGTRIDENTRIHDFTFDYGLQFRFRIDSLKKRNPKLKTGCARIIDGKCVVYNNCKVDTSHHVGTEVTYIHTDSTTHIEKKRVRTDIEDISVGLGLTYAPTMNLSASYDLLARNYIMPGTLEIYKDTLVNLQGQSTVAHIPTRIGFGISVNKSYRWNILADYTYQQWSDYSFNGTNGGLQNSMQGSLGFQFQPALRGRYFQIARYRMGLLYNQTYLDLKDTRLVEYGLTFGAAFPVAISRVKRHEYDINLYRNYSMVNVSVELGQMGTSSNGLIKENYGRVVLGFTINDRWFQHFKYND
jgi:hypothetical protein